MPVEDIQYLQEHSVQENAIIFSDSSRRDYHTYPQPNHYVLEFEQPYEFVTGVELLDASIPRTMYVVDVNTQLLVLYYGNGLLHPNYYLDTDHANVVRVEIKLTPQDYNSIDELIEELDGQLAEFGINVTALSESSPTQKSKMKFTSTLHPFLFDMKASTCREVVGFDTLSSYSTPDSIYQRYTLQLPEEVDPCIDTQLLEHASFTEFYKERRATCETEDQQRPVQNERLFGSKTTAGDVATRFLLYEDGTSPSFLSFSDNGVLFASRFSFQELQQVDDYFELKYSVFQLRTQLALSSVTIQYQIYAQDNVNVLEDIPVGTPMYTGVLSLQTPADMNTFLQENNETYRVDTEEADICYGVFASTTASPIFLPGKDEYFWIVLRVVSGDASAVELAVSSSREVLVSTTDTSNYIIRHSTSDWSTAGYVQNVEGIVTIQEAIPLENNPTINYVFHGFFSLSQTLHTIVPPGIVSLVGERYVILRCREIDSHAQVSYAYTKTTPGLALFKLGVLGFAEERYDFSSFRQKPFHPIGKLSRLTFRFERLDGALYDFKSVNHHLTIVIKYLVPNDNATSLANHQKSMLNPNYNPDFMQYMLDHHDRKERNTDSEEEEDEDDLAEIRDASTSSVSSEEDGIFTSRMGTFRAEAQSQRGLPSHR